MVSFLNTRKFNAVGSKQKWGTDQLLVINATEIITIICHHIMSLWKEFQNLVKANLLSQSRMTSSMSSRRESAGVALPTV